MLKSWYLQNFKAIVEKRNQRKMTASMDGYMKE